MHICVNNFHQGGKYIAQIASDQEELLIEGKYTELKYLSITSIYTDYINLDGSSGFCKNNEKSNIV